MACEKCWGDAYLRMRSNPYKTQAEHYRELLEERKGNPCSKEQQRGAAAALEDFGGGRMSETQRVIPIEEVEEILRAQEVVWLHGLGHCQMFKLLQDLKKAARYPWEAKPSYK
jgi:hypothetical protein